VRIAGFRTGAGSVSGAMVGSIAGSYAGGSWNANVVGSIIGAIGVSGAPNGDADDSCAKAGIAAIRDEIEM